MRQHGLSCERRLIEKNCSGNTEAAGLEVSSFVKEQKALVEINQPGPNEIFFVHEHLACFYETFESLHRFALLAASGRFVCQCLCGFRTHAQFFEPQKTFMG